MNTSDPTINLDQLVADALTQQQAKEIAERDAADEAKQQKLQALADAFGAELDKDFGADLIAALGIEIHISSNRQQETIAVGRFHDEAGKCTYELSIETVPFRNHLKWNRTIIHGKEHISKFKSYEREEARTRLLADIGFQRQGVIRQDKEDEEAALKQVERNHQLEAERQQRALNEAAEQAERDAIKARINLILDAARQQTLDTLWRWPTGVEVAIYRVRWCNGSYRDEDEAYFHFDEGWSAREEADEFGWWYFFVERESEPKIRALRLTTEHHKVVVERFVLSSTGDAAKLGLGESVRAVAHGVRWEVDRYGDMGHLVEDPDGSHDFYIDAHMPAYWIRELVDAQDAEDQRASETE